MNAEVAIPKSKFEMLASINVNTHIEKKNGLSYLSWAWALDQLLRQDPDADWEYLEPKMFGETMMVYCTVTAFGKPRTAHLPVMDHRNQPIPNPNAFQINTAMQRVLVKAIALHGLGLYIYAGEDLPEGEKQDGPKQDEPEPVEAGYLRAAKTLDDLQDVWRSLKPAERQRLGKVKDTRKAEILKANEATQP
jgi:hypothetical protein